MLGRKRILEASVSELRKNPLLLENLSPYNIEPYFIMIILKQSVSMRVFMFHGGGGGTVHWNDVSGTQKEL